MKSSIKKVFKKGSFLRRKSKFQEGEDATGTRGEQEHSEASSGIISSETSTSVTATDKPEIPQAAGPSSEEKTPAGPSDQRSIETAFSSEKSMPQSVKEVSPQAQEESSPASKPVRMPESTQDALLGTRPPPRPQPSAIRSEVSERLAIDDSPLIVRSYDAIPVLDQTKLPRGGVSVETQAVGRVQVRAVRVLVLVIHRCYYRRPYLTLSLLSLSLFLLFSLVSLRKRSRTACHSACPCRKCTLYLLNGSAERWAPR